MQNQNPRRKKLIEKRIQLKFVGAVITVAGLSVLVQTLVLHFALSGLIAGLPNDRVTAMEAVPDLMATSLFATFAVLLPLSFLVGVTTSFKVAGPIYRLRTYLREVVSGTAVEPCRLRKDDELQDLCELVNEATEERRRTNARDSGERKAA